MGCINCLHFKFKKGWKKCFCSAGNLLDGQHKDRIFKFFTLCGRDRFKTIIDRAKELKFLNQNCSLFNSLD